MHCITFLNRAVNFLILFLSTETPTGCIESLKWDRLRLSINCNFFFLCTLFLVLLVSYLDLRLAFITEFFSLSCFDNNNTVSNTRKRICKKRPFNSFGSTFNIRNNKSLWPCTYEKPINITQSKQVTNCDWLCNFQ